MVGIETRLPMLFDIRGENRQLLRANYGDATKDREGKCSASLIADLRFFAVAEFVLFRDIERFRSQLKEAAEIRKRVFDRIDAGEPIDNSYDSILGYKDVLNALAAGEFDVAELLAKRTLQSSVRPDVHEFDEAFGRALCSIVTEADLCQVYVDSLQTLCSTCDTDFCGYAELFLAVLCKNTGSANKALANVIAGHRRQSLASGVFNNTEDEVLALWAIGVANLARNHGVDVVTPNEKLIPNDLLI